MMYRLKPEAVPFFKEDLATDVKDLGQWEQLHVDMNALEEVKPVFISYGVKRDNMHTHLSGWDQDGSHLHFTLNFPSMKWKEHDEFDNGRIIRGLMDRIQRVTDDYTYEFIKNTESKTH